MTDIEKLKEELSFYKTYFCGCKAAPRTAPDHCPEHSLPAIDFDGAWEAVSNDESLKSIRRKLSIHELRTLFNVSSSALVRKQ